ncbi:MAG: hypothetical protein WED33_11485 [Bacteroidia bacterium]
MTGISALFIIITLICIILFYLANGKDKRVLVFLPIWFIIAGVISYSGFLQFTDSFPPRILAIMIPVIIYIIYFARKLDTKKLNVNLLIAISIVRIPVEVGLFMLYEEGKIPVYMTFEGWNFDILSGISAMLLFFLLVLKVKFPSLILKLWNIAALILLAIIVITAILSVPGPAQKLAFEQPNTAILEFPFTYLPAIIVPIVLLSHLLLFRYFRRQASTSSA